MAKINWKPGCMVYPLPAVMVSCGFVPEEYNILTIAWTGTICSNPPMCYISVRPSRHSFGIIKRTGEFVINLTTEKLAYATDWCGSHSGKNFNKWKETGLTPIPSKIVRVPAIAEAPVSIECKVRDIIDLGSHHMFISEVVNIMADDAYLDESGEFDLSKAKPLVFSHDFYFGTGEKIGKYGWASKKNPG